MDADCIYTTFTGSPLAAFVRELRSRGCTAQLMTPSDATLGFWGLVKAVMTPDELDGTVVANWSPWWSEDVEFIREVKTYIEKYLSPEQQQEVYDGTGRMAGWALGMIFVDVVRRATQNVGPQNVDGQSLRDAIIATDMTVEGFGNLWKIDPANNIRCFYQTLKIYQYQSSQDDWIAISDWYRPSSLTG